MSKQHILITGANSFVGRNLAEFFRRDGRYTVLVPPKSEVDYANDELVDAFFKNHPIDVVVHCATTSMIGKSYPPETCENNLRMFFNLQRVMTASMKMINLGSGSEYARAYWRPNMHEAYFGEHVPRDSHSYSKYLISQWIRDAHDPRFVHLRLFGVFGKYENYLYKFISNAIAKNLLGIPITINQNAVYDYLCVADLCRIIEYFVCHDTQEKTFNITPTESIDLVSIANLVEAVGGRQLGVRVLHDGFGMEYTGDNTRLMQEIGDFSFTPYDVAIADLYAYYRTIQDTLDADAVRQDLFLNYAKELQRKYS